MKQAVENIVEVWKEVSGWSNYFVSTEGRVKCLEKTWASGRNKNIVRRMPEHIKTQTIDTYGYARVILRNNGLVKYVTVHRLVATAFIPNPENKPQINHINGVKTDNTLRNLEWVTQSENTVHAIKLGLVDMGKGETARYKKLNRSSVNAIRASVLPKKTLADKFGVTVSTIQNIQKLKSWL